MTVVYSCVTGRYDKTLQPVQPTDDIAFVCFTDSSSLKAPGWRVAPLASPERLTSGHDINRFHKAFPHHLFPEHRWSIYLDGNIRFDGDWAELIDIMHRCGAALGAFTHPSGRNLVEEVDACARLGKFDARDIGAARRQLALYAGRGFNTRAPISANYLIVRDHHARGLDEAMSLWWSQLFEYSKRDQISLQYALFRHGLAWTALDAEGGVDAGLLTRTRHRQPLSKRVEGLVRRVARRLSALGDGKR